MPDIKIELLTPVHIGSGKDLMSNTEYLYFEDEQLLTVIDEQKVLQLIGEQNIDKWVNIIQNNQSLKQYLLQVKGDLEPADIEKRSMNVFGSGIAKHKTLKEQLHDGKQISFIPGSSIKGAIRTAIVSHYALQNPDLSKHSLKNHKGRYDAQVLEKKLFGENPNKDVFRFLQIGDAYFNCPTIATKVHILNSYYNNWHFKQESSHLVECIAQEADSEFRLKINTELLQKNNPVNKTDFLEMKQLFNIINQHTLRLLEKEKDFWQEDDNVQETAFENYMENINRLIEICKNCNEKETVLRIGFGSGWDFITGAWTKDFGIMGDNEYDRFVNIMRRNKNYDMSVPFPKTRKMDEDGDILGFIKLSLI